MIGVYIKDMDKPSDCDLCNFEDYGYCRALLSYINVEEGIDTRCPLIEVKAPHGRLIDADAIDTSYSDPEVVETLKDAPTVIEADGE